jgi:hypothetical protein
MQFVGDAVEFAQKLNRLQVLPAAVLVGDPVSGFA